MPLADKAAGRKLGMECGLWLGSSIFLGGGSAGRNFKALWRRLGHQDKLRLYRHLAEPQQASCARWRQQRNRGGMRGARHSNKLG